MNSTQDWEKKLTHFMDGWNSFLESKNVYKNQIHFFKWQNTIFCTFEKYTLHQQSVGLSQKLNQD
jgi:hypothetical protein